MEIICFECGKVFEGRGPSKYCSKECSNKAKLKREHPKQMVICPQCGIQFLQKSKNTQYCSRDCGKKHYYAQNIEKYKKIRKERYQSNPLEAKLKAKLWREQNREKFKEQSSNYHDKMRYGGNREKCFERDGHKCTKCGSIKNIIPHHIDESGQSETPNNSLENLITLCKKCHMALHDPNPNKSNRVKCICKQCNKEFEETPSRVRDGKGKFCSRECRKLYGYTKTD